MQNSRRAKTISVSVTVDEKSHSITRSFPLHHCNIDYVANSAWTAINKSHGLVEKVNTSESTPLKW